VDGAIYFLYGCPGIVSLVKYQGHNVKGSKDRPEAIHDILKIFPEGSYILMVSQLNLVEKTFDFQRHTLGQPLERVIGMSQVGKYKRSGSAVDPLQLNNAPVDLPLHFNFR